MPFPDVIHSTKCIITIYYETITSSLPQNSTPDPWALVSSPTTRETTREMEVRLDGTWAPSLTRSLWTNLDFNSLDFPTCGRLSVSFLDTPWNRIYRLKHGGRLLLFSIEPNKLPLWEWQKPLQTDRAFCELVRKKSTLLKEKLCRGGWTLYKAVGLNTQCTGYFW